MKIPALYQKYYIDKADERAGLFRIFKDDFSVKKGIYPGSFTHVTPSFFIPEMVYVDLDKRCKKFFSDIETFNYVCEKKNYTSRPVFRFHQQDFTCTLDENENSFDFMISLYSGFISQYCKKYLKTGGFLLVNNSHGDAALSFLDNDYKLLGIVKRREHKFSIHSKNPGEYFQTKSGKPINKEMIVRTMRGPAYTKPAYGYIFQKV